MGDGPVLRRIEMDDWNAVHDWARLPESSRYQAWGPNSKDDTRAFVEHTVVAWGRDPVRDRVYVAELHGEVIGTAVLHIRDRTQAQGEISYAVHPKLWGRGLATALGRELLRIGFDDQLLHRIAGTCDPRNAASAAVLRRIGMTYEGLMRHTSRLDGEWRDSQLYAILAHEWSYKPKYIDDDVRIPGQNPESR